ncbi:hypothetical protein CBR_g31165 [Chara braunii]|uniref:F-box domain-containing protein n=1 Tax=Chara braunii TaxID=69332 RepID=A0A388LEI1_CHABU|nr:hypothetical protein CBR_g31165 [Chara braunii]|eukprot:GBG80708.1 hypothetical protein CBR_g31165 [Chara braunii]
MDQLPDSLILKILSSLKYAEYIVRCSVLSKRLNELVWQVPEVYFRPVPGIYKCEWGSEYGLQQAVTATVSKTKCLKRLVVKGDETDHITQYAMRTWLSHVGSTLESLEWDFRLFSPSRVYVYSVHHPMNLLAYCKRLKKCKLQFQGHGDFLTSIQLPSLLGTFKQLQVLSAPWCVEDKQSVISTWLQLLPNLERLTLQPVSGPALQHLCIEGCMPKLQELTIETEDDNELVLIDLPSLETLFVSACGSLKVRSGAKLKHLRLDVSRSMPDAVWDLSDDVQLKTLEITGRSYHWCGRETWERCRGLFTRNRRSLQTVGWETLLAKPMDDCVSRKYLDFIILAATIQPSVLSEPFPQLQNLRLLRRSSLCQSLRHRLEELQQGECSGINSSLPPAAASVSSSSSSLGLSGDKIIAFFKRQYAYCRLYRLYVEHLSIVSALVELVPMLDSMEISAACVEGEPMALLGGSEDRCSRVKLRFQLGKS